MARKIEMTLTLLHALMKIFISNSTLNRIARLDCSLNCTLGKPWRLGMKSVVALMLFVTSVAAFAEVEVKTDRFTGRTRYSTPSGAQYNTLTPFATILVSDGKMIPSFDLVMWGSFPHWKYIDCTNNIHWILDGKPVQFPPAEYLNDLDGKKAMKGEIILDGVYYLGLPIEKLKAIASASVVEYKICGDEYKFDETTLSNFRELWSKFATAK
jgi:hypothetical protein